MDVTLSGNSIVVNELLSNAYAPMDVIPSGNSMDFILLR